MATVLDKKTETNKAGLQVDEQIAQAASRIRWYDVTFGGVILLGIVLCYATGMILLDRYLNLPEWIRQLALGGLVATLLTAGYFLILEPLRRRVNPLYAAVQVEKTIDDAKNSVAGYVDAREKGTVHPIIRQALGSRAAKAAREADLNRAIDHRGLVFAGLAAVVFLLTLIVLFFIFRPAQFTSLATRAFAPFTSDKIASRTQIELLIPQNGNVEITAGESLTIRVEVAGRMPDRDSPDRLRVQFRQSPQAPYSEIPLDEEVRDRVWQVVIPSRSVGPGIYYKVVGGDTETPEYRVTVRSLPGLTETGDRIRVAYKYPAYIRWDADESDNPNIRNAVPGTQVTVTARMNRPVQSGYLRLTPGAQVAGQASNEQPESLRATFRLGRDDGLYRIVFTSTAGETNESNPIGPYEIKIRPDAIPTVRIDKPLEPVIDVPADGLLTVDALLNDDFGLDSAVLKLRVVKPVAIELADRPYQPTKPFRREEKSGGFSWPRTLTYKDSVPLRELTRKPIGNKPAERFELKEGMELEYWVEARDNRHTVNAAGEEKLDSQPSLKPKEPKRVRITAATKPEEKDKAQQAEQNRKAEEQQHNQAQDQRLQQENRPRNEQKPNQGDRNPQQGNPQPGSGQPEQKNDPNNTGNAGAQNMGQPDRANPPNAGNPNNPMDGNPNPTNNSGMPPPNGQPSKDPDQKVQDNANRVQDALNQQNEGSSAKPNPASTPEQRTEPATAKPPAANQPNNGAPPQDNPKDPPPQPGMENSQGSNAAEPKPSGELQPPPSPAETKPQPPQPGNGGTTGMPPTPPAAQPGSDPASPKPQPQPNGMNPSEDKPKPEPKTNPQGMNPGNMGNNMTDPKEPGTPKPNQDPSGGGMAKPAGQQQPEPGMPPEPGMNPPQSQPNSKDPAAGAGTPKPNPQNDRGMDKPAGSQSGETPSTPSTENAAQPKPQQSPETASTKPTPKDGMGNPMPQSGAPQTAPKPEPKDGAGAASDPASRPAEPKPEPKEPAPGAAAQDKPAAGQNTPPGNAQKPEPKSGSGAPSPKANPEEVLNTARDLNDPNKRNGAQNKLDQQVGRPAREEIEKHAGGLNSPKPDEKRAAEDKIRDIARKGSSDGAAPQTGNKLDPEDVKRTARDLNSTNPDMKRAAEEKLDGQVGKANREEIAKHAGDLNSNDKDRRGAAERKVEDIVDKVNGQRGDGSANGDRKVDPKAVEQAIKDLKEGDPSKKDGAKQTLDENLGQGAGRAAENAVKDLKDVDGRRQARGQKTLDDMQAKANRMAQPQLTPKEVGERIGEQRPPRKLTPEEEAREKELIDKLVKQAPDLNSPDPEKRRKAEEEFDNAIGEANRKKLQEQFRDRLAGPKDVPLKPAMEDDPRHKARAADLQLEQFEKNRDNAELLRRLGWTQKEYDEFLKEYEKAVARLRDQAADAEAAELPQGTGTATGNANTAGRTDALGTGGSTRPSGGAGVPFEPPGFRDALKQFREDAAKFGSGPKK